ncbi:MAG: TIGR01212 family radical SAM protein [Eubacteriales bacterium]|nr:TIGR01212 family radical SAM protein [Eubacteriales bacterium]
MKPYYSFDDQMKECFGGKVYRLALSAAVTCPNRDGTCGTGGCIFCSAGGSGDFAESSELGIAAQIELAKKRVAGKLSKSFAGYMAYFQSYTETYGDQDYLASCFKEAAAKPEILALSIATRPDSISDEMLLVLKAINAEKPVYIELGLQTIHEDTARYINRGYSLSVFEDAVKRIRNAGLGVVVHVIIGLPGEDEEKTRDTVKYLAELNIGGAHIDGIKLQLLHVLKGTRLAKLLPEIIQEEPCGRAAETALAEKGHGLRIHERIILNDGNFLTCYNMERYAEFVAELVGLLPGDIAVHRLTGDAPKKLLLCPKWTADKKRVLNTITKAFGSRGQN